MRSDMSKVVTERPRSGARFKSPKGEKRSVQKLDQEDLPKREKIGAKWLNLDGKQFTDVLGPLYGYLLKQVGRPWNKVYSDIVKHLPKRYCSKQSHLLPHLAICGKGRNHPKWESLP